MHLRPLYGENEMTFQKIQYYCVLRRDKTKFVSDKPNTTNKCKLYAYDGNKLIWRQILCVGNDIRCVSILRQWTQSKNFRTKFVLLFVILETILFFFFM